jgi:hypothetical protein
MNCNFMYDHPLPSSSEADINNEWSFTSIPPYAFMACTGITLSLPQFRKFCIILTNVESHNAAFVVSVLVYSVWCYMNSQFSYCVLRYYELAVTRLMNR